MIRKRVRWSLIALMLIPPGILFHQHLKAPELGLSTVTSGVALFVVACLSVLIARSCCKLIASEARYKAIARSIPDGAVFLFDADLRFTAVEGGMLERLGLSEEEVVGKTPHDAFTLGIAEELIPGMLNALQGKKDHLELSYWGRLMKLDILPLASETKKRSGLVVIEDVTDERTYETALAEEKRRISTLIANMPGMVYRCVYDERRTMEFVSDGCVELTGYEPEEMVLNRKVSWPEIVHVEDREAINEELEAARKEGRPFVLSYRIATRLGAEKRVWERGVFVTFESENLVLQEGIILDDTARYKAERNARLRQEQLIQADRLASLGTLITGVAHEINNPNTVISLNMPMIENIWKDAAAVLEQRHAVGDDITLAGARWPDIRDEVEPLMTKVTQSSRRIRNIVSDLKGFARQDKGGEKPVDLVEVVRAASGLVENKIARSTEFFSMELPDHPVMISGDFQRLEQVVVNMLINACEALTSTQQAVAVSIRIRPGQAEIRVWDEGRGMDRHTRRHALEPFYTTKQSEGGTGLGLYISQDIVRKHGGSISMESMVGKGTLSRVILPVGARTPPEKDALEGRR